MDSGNPTDMLIPSIPASPQATAFQRVGDYQVNNASGVPDISIPLFELDHHGYKMPITLRYLPTPLKHGYNYDVTGHGWALNLGSCISRTIESWPDEKYDFKLNVAPIDRDLSLAYEGNNVGDYIEQCDLGRDRFNVTLPNGKSFSFFITNYSGNISIVSGVLGYDVQFNCSQTKHITSFTVIDNSGVQYLFDITELSINQTRQTNGSEVAWYLSKITIPHVSKPIYFKYEKSITQNNGHGATEPVLIMKRLWGGTGSTDRLTFNYYKQDTWTHYQTKLLTKISFGTTEVDFKYNNDNTTTTYNNLISISIKDNQTEVRGIKFEYTFLSPSGTLALLRKLTITGKNTTDKLVYKFLNHPARAIHGTDHWGYGNSVCDDYSYNLRQIANMNFYTEYYGIDLDLLIGNSGLPVTPIDLAANEYSLQQKAKLLNDITGSDPREPAAPENHGILSAIIYPTGGKTVFVFENHRFVSATDVNGNYIATKKKRRVIKAGGFRIKSITNYTSDGKVSDAREFRYGPTNQEVKDKKLNLPIVAGARMDEHIGYGEPVVDPNILTYTKIKSSSDVTSKISRMLIGKNHPNDFPNTMQNYSGKSGYQCTFSPLNFRCLLQGREPVVYSEITEYHGQMEENVTPQNTTGKTVYEFQIYDDSGSTPDSVYNVPLRWDGNTLLVEGSAYKKDYLTKKTDYTFYYYNGKYFPTKLQTETYKYSLNHRTATSYILANNYDYGWFWYYDIYGNGHETFRVGFVLSPISVGSYKMTEKEVTRDGITTTERIAYNGDGLIKELSFTGAKPHTTTFTYPVTGHSAIETKLCNKHIYSCILKSQTKSHGNSTWDVSGYSIDYADFGVGLLPSKLSRLSVANGVSTGYEEDVRVLSYSSSGNPTEVKDRSGIYTAYVWGYNDRYLIAEAKNARLSTVTTALNALSGNVEGLRTHASLSNAMVTTWTYLPLVGVTSQTDASGISTYYDYDGLGRLKEVYRYKNNVKSSANKQILHQYNYHTITQ